VDRSVASEMSPAIGRNVEANRMWTLSLPLLGIRELGTKEQ